MILRELSLIICDFCSFRSIIRREFSELCAASLVASSHSRTLWPPPVLSSGPPCHFERAKRVEKSV